MSKRLRDLADYISQLRHKHARALKSDLTLLQDKYGPTLVRQALALSQQTDLRNRMRVDGHRSRNHARLESDQLAAEVFAKREGA